MNKIYKTVWNKRLGQVVAASEVARGDHGGAAVGTSMRTLRLAVAPLAYCVALMFAAPMAAQAQAVGTVVTCATGTSGSSLANVVVTGACVDNKATVIGNVTYSGNGNTTTAQIQVDPAWFGGALAPITFAGDSGSAPVKLDETLKITGGATTNLSSGANIGVTAVPAVTDSNGNITTPAGMQLQLAQDLKGLNTIQLGGTAAPVTLGGDTKGNLALNPGGTAVRITNVAPGVNLSDGATVSQLPIVLAGTGVSVTTGEKDGQPTYTVSSTAGSASSFGLGADDGKVVMQDSGKAITIHGKDGNVLTTTDETGKAINLALANAITVGATNPITVNGNTGTVDGLTNTSFAPGGAVSGRAASEDQLQDLVDLGMNFAGNQNPAAGFIHRNLGDTLPIVGGAKNTAAAGYSSDNVKTVATDAGGVEIQFADTPNFQGADMGGGQITSVASGMTDSAGAPVTKIGDAVQTNAANIGDLKHLATGGEGTGGFGLLGTATGSVAAMQDLGQTITVTDPEGNITATTVAGTSTNAPELQLSLGNGLQVGGDGKDGSIGVSGADGETGVGINGADGSIGMTGPAGANGTPAATLSPQILPGNVQSDTTNVTRLAYTDGDGNEHTVATLQDDGQRYSGNETTNAATGNAYITRNLNTNLPIVGGATTNGTYSDANVKTVATQDGGIDIQFAENPVFTTVQVGGSTGPVIGGAAAVGTTPAQVTLNAGSAPVQIKNVAAGVDPTDAVNVSQLSASQTHDYSVNSTNTGTDTNYDNGGATGGNALAAGVNASASGVDATAIGHGATASGNTTIAIGVNANQKYDSYGSKLANNTVIGGGRDATIAIPGNQNWVTGATYTEENFAGYNGTAVGWASQAFNSGGTAIGTRSHAGDPTVAGNVTHPATAVGYGTTAAGDGSTSIGVSSVAQSKDAIAMGHRAFAVGENSIALGLHAQTGQYDQTAGTVVGGKDSIAIGNTSVVNGDSSIAVGTGNTVNGDNSGAFGDPSVIDADDSYSVGNNNHIGAAGNPDSTSGVFVLGNNNGTASAPIVTDDTYALGSNIDFTALGTANDLAHQGSVTLGSGSAAAINDAGTGNALFSGADVPTGGAVSVGSDGSERQIKNVAGGTEDTDAVNIAQLTAGLADTQTHYYSVKSTATGPGSNYDNDGATGSNALAAGVSASAAGDSSVAVGYQTGTGSTGSGNVALGNSTGQNVATSANVAIGQFTGNRVSEDTTGQYKPFNVEGNNVAIGGAAGQDVAGNTNVAIGWKAGGSADKVPGVNGNSNVAIGPMSGQNVTGSINTAVGSSAGENVKGGANTAFGNFTGVGVTGSNNVAMGNNAGNNITASNTISLGTSSIASQGNATAIGQYAGANGTGAIAIGGGAQPGTNNYVKANGANSISIGSGAGNGASSTVKENIAIGTGAGINVNSEQNVAIGSGSGANITNVATSGSTGTDGLLGKNALVGTGSGNNLKGNANSGLGFNSLNLADGNNNVGLGAYSGWKSQGDLNIYQGNYTGSSTTGNRNVAIGNYAGNRMSNSSSNVFLGDNAGSGNTNGQTTDSNYNIAIGTAAGQGLQRVTDSIALGRTSSAGTESVAIGKGAQVTGASSIGIGTGNIVTGANSGAIGDPNKISGSGSYAVGNNNTIDADNAFVLGNNVTVGAGFGGAVVLGNRSAAANNAAGPALFSGDAIPAGGAVSVGSDGSERQVKNVAGGTDDTDAVNIAQLKAGLADTQTHDYSVNSTTPGTDTNYDNGGATGSNALAAGVSALAAGAGATAVGNGAQAGGASSVSVGDSAQANDGESISIGHQAGLGSKSNGGNVTFPGMGAGANTFIGAAAGRDYQGDGTIAIGIKAGANGTLSPVASGDNNVYMGTLAGAGSTSDRTIIIGSQAGDSTVNDRSILIGNAVNINQTSATRNAIGIGSLAVVKGQEASAIGFNAQATSNGTIALGRQAKAGDTTNEKAGTNAIAIGTSAGASGMDAVALGHGSTVSGTSSIAVGTGNTVSGDNSGAFGDPNTISGSSSYAFGNDNTIDSDNAFVLGNNVTVGTGFNGAVVLGKGSAAANNAAGPALYSNAAIPSGGAVSVGAADAERQIKNVAGGTDDTDAVNIAQLTAGLAATQTHDYSVNSTNPGADTNYDNSGATGSNALAAGVSASAAGDNAVAVGNAAEATGGNAISIGNAAGKGSTGSNIALGNGVGQNVATGSNVIIGDAGAGNDMADDSTYYKPFNVSGNNVAIGGVAGQSQQGTTNVSIGWKSGQGAQGNANVGVGPLAGLGAKGSINTAVGASAGSYTQGTGNTALGNFSGTSVLGDNNVALGNSAGNNVNADRTMSLGYKAQADDDDAVALGANSQAVNANDVALGAGSVTDAQHTGDFLIAGAPGTAAGLNSGAAVVSLGTAGAERQIQNVAPGVLSATSTDAINGSQLYATNQLVAQNKTHYYSVKSTATGPGSNYDNDGATGADSLAAGANAAASGTFSTAVGNGAQAGYHGTAIGHGADNLLGNGVALGNGAVAGNALVSGEGVAVAVGNAAQAGNYGLAIGGGTGNGTSFNTAGERSTAVGVESNAYGVGSVAMGNRSVAGNAADAAANPATRTNAVAIGTGTQATGTGSTAVGTGNIVTGDHSGAFGDPNTVSGTGSYALGNDNTIDSDNAFVLGNNVNVASGFDGSVTLGDGSAADNNDDGTKAAYSGEVINAGGAVSVGSADGRRQIKNVAGATTDYDAVNLAQLNAGLAATQTHFYSVNSSDPTAGNYNNDGATGVNALAAGVGATAAGEAATAVGDGASADDFGGTALGASASATKAFGTAVGAGATADGEFATALGTSASVTGDGGTAVGGGATASGGSTALGTGAAASGTTSTAAGLGASAAGESAVALGANSEAINDNDVALGAGSITDVQHTGDFLIAGAPGTAAGLNSGAAVVSVGTAGGERQIQNVAPGVLSATSTDAINGSQLYATNQQVDENKKFQSHYYSVNDNGTHVANFNNDGATGNMALAAGPFASASGNASTAVGQGTNAAGAQSVAVGTYASATKDGAVAMGNSVTASGAQAVASGAYNTASGDGSVAMGNTNSAEGIEAVALGAYNNRNGVAAGDFSSALGVNNTAGGVGSTSVGNFNYVTGDGSTALGGGNTVLGKNSIAAGVGNEVTGDNSGAFGDPNVISGNGSYAFGNNNTIDSDNAFVLGNDVNVGTGLDGSVTLGNSSAAANNAAGPAKFSGDSIASGGAVSVGAAGAERQIKNVAGGTAGTDAVNVNQLQAVADTANAGWNVSTNGDTKGQSNVAPGATVDFSNTDGNVKIAHSGTDVTVDLNPDLNVDSVTTGNTKMDNSGVAVNDGAGNSSTLSTGGLEVTNSGGDSTTYAADGMTIAGGPTVTKDNVDMGGQQVHGVAAGTAGTDAVNVDQLKAGVAGATTEVVAGTNVGVTKTTADDGHSVYKVDADGTSVSAGSTALTVTKGAKDANNVTDYAVDLSQGTKDDIQQGVDAKEIVDTKGLTFNGDTGTTGAKLLGDSVAVTGDSNITTTADSSGVQVSLNKDLDLGATGSVTMGDTTVNNGGMTIAGGPSVTTGGIDAGGQKIINVAPGEDGTDAVNLNQLNAGIAGASTEVQGGTNIASVTKTTGADGHAVYTVNAKGASVSAGSSAVTVSAAAKPGNITDYAVDLSQGTKDDIQQGVDAKTIVDTKGLTFNGDTGTTGPKLLGSTVNITGDNNITTTANSSGVQVQLNKDLNLGNDGSVTVGGTTVNNNGVTTGGGEGPSLTQNGVNAGGQAITNVAPGMSGTDAANLNQLAGTARDLRHRINKVDRNASAGVASAIASANLPQPYRPGTGGLGAALGGFRGQGALAVGASAISENGSWVFKGSMNFNSQGKVGVGGGFLYVW